MLYYQLPHLSHFESDLCHKRQNEASKLLSHFQNMLQYLPIPLLWHPPTYNVLDRHILMVTSGIHHRMVWHYRIIHNHNAARSNSFLLYYWILIGFLWINLDWTRNWMRKCDSCQILLSIIAYCADYHYNCTMHGPSNPHGIHARCSDRRH